MSRKLPFDFLGSETEKKFNPEGSDKSFGTEVKRKRLLPKWKGFSGLLTVDRTRQRSHLIVFIDIVFIIIFVGFIYPLARSAVSSTHIEGYNAVIKRVKKSSGNLLIVKLTPLEKNNSKTKPPKEDSDSGGIFDYSIINSEGEEVLKGSDTLPGKDRHRLITYRLKPEEEKGVYRCIIAIGESSEDMVLDLTQIEKRKKFEPLKVFKDMIKEDKRN